MPQRISQISLIKKVLFIVIFFAILAILFFLPYLLPAKTDNQITIIDNTANVSESLNNVKHIKTPESLKAIYMTSWVAGTLSLRKNLIELIKSTELNAIVIDIKDYSGKIAFKTDEKVNRFGASEERISDIKDLLKELHDNNIYVIGRISAFQDSFLVNIKPAWGVKKQSDKNELWRDRKGIAWIDAGSEEMWRYLSDIGHFSYSIGFDELNFDYIRFPSDGNMEDIYYPYSEGEEKKEVIRKFFGFLYKEFRDTGAVLSADLFGMTTTNTDDLNIGQYLEYALPYFDFVAPMVYPSHYPATFLGFSNPAEHPYEVIKFSMDEAVKRASTTPEKIRPWLQDFDLGADYDAGMVRAQIQATYDAGLKSFMLWSPSNRYTKDALKGQ